MANFTETRIQSMITELRDEFGSEIATRELALLELEDLERKGCHVEYTHYCLNCPAYKENNCLLNDWETRHPEYANDALAMKIRILEAGGEEAYVAKLKAQEEAKKKAEEEKLKATDTEVLEAARHILKLYFNTWANTPGAEYLKALNEVLNTNSKPVIEATLAKISN